MVLALCRDRLLHLAKSYLKEGEIPNDEYENFHELYDAYTGFGGNSMVKKLCEEALSLQIGE